MSGKRLFPTAVLCREEKTLHSKLEEAAMHGTMFSQFFCIDYWFRNLPNALAMHAHVNIDDWFRTLPNALAMHGTILGTQIVCMDP